MRLQSLTLCLAMLLGSCAQPGDGADNSAAANTAETAPAEPAARRQPANSTSAAQPSGQLSLSAAPAQATAAATMTLTLSNGSSEHIGYNLCTSDLETNAGRTVPTGGVCTMELRTLEPGRTADHRYQLPVNMVAGSYRFLTQVESMQSRRRSGVRSNSFEVR